MKELEEILIKSGIGEITLETAIQQVLDLFAVSGSIDSMKKAMDSFKKELEEANKENPDDLVIKGANWGYNKAVEQFHNRFAKYYR